MDPDRNSVHLGTRNASGSPIRGHFIAQKHDLAVASCISHFRAAAGACQPSPPRGTCRGGYRGNDKDTVHTHICTNGR